MICYIDMGTTNIRVYNLLSEEPIYTGVEGVLFFNDENKFNKDKFVHFLEIKLNLQGKKLFISGMLGSDLGLCTTKYISFSKLFNLKIEDLEQVNVNTNQIYIFPGVTSNLDIMRGEEMELLGVVKNYKLENYKKILFPGTHAKLLTLEQGKIKSFSTLFTGELIKLVINESTLFTGKNIAVSNVNADHLRKIEEPLIESLFKCRALQVLGELTEISALEHLLSIIYTEETNLLKENKSLIICDENRKKFYQKYGTFDYETKIMSLEGFKYFYENNTDYFSTI